MFEQAKKTSASHKSLAPVEKTLAEKLDGLVQFANGNRASIGIKRLHVERAIRLVADGAPLAWTFGARSMSSRVAFILVTRAGDDVTVTAVDCRRVDAYKGPAHVFQGLGTGWASGTLEKAIEGETPEKLELARTASRGIEIHALAQVTDPGLKERIKLFGKSSAATEKSPQGDVGVQRVRASLAEVAKFLGIES